MRFDVVTLFPDMFPGYLSQSLLNKAIEAGIVEVEIHDLRNWSLDDKHQSVDDRPFGGGPGMVLRVEPVVECVEAIKSATRENREANEKQDIENDGCGDHLVLFTPGGRKLSQKVVEELATHDRIILLCGRYEGFDQRVVDILEPDELSVGDFVLNGGEVAAMVLIDTVVRLIPGVLGDERSHHDDSFSTGNRLLEGEQYTRPREYRGHTVPEVLLSGDHGRIAEWRKQRSLERTKQRRSDLLTNKNPNETDKDQGK